MNKIRKYLIHLLGGVTGEEHQQEVSYHFKAARAHAILHLKRTMDGCYGQPAEEWCKNIYEYTCNRCEQALKNLKDYEESINYSKNIL